MRTITLLLVAGLVACGSTKPDSDADAKALNSECEAAIKSFKTSDSTIAKTFETAHGFAVFPSIGKGAIGIGGAYGRGQVYEQGRHIGYTTIKQGTIGLALGGQSFSELIFFKDSTALAAFREGNFELTAQASAVAVKEGAGAASEYSNGIKVFVMVKGGLMAEAAVGGQKFAYEAK